MNLGNLTIICFRRFSRLQKYFHVWVNVCAELASPASPTLRIPVVAASKLMTLMVIKATCIPWVLIPNTSRRLGAHQRATADSSSERIMNDAHSNPYHIYLTIFLRERYRRLLLWSSLSNLAAISGNGKMSS
ncbi:unnamed protein product [Somion occarium]|uniref:Uncharacterized protein n=1 Tax=Somion occarium TaxID=3059160 RepID=A0ABP1DJ08_9APHY